MRSLLRHLLDIGPWIVVGRYEDDEGVTRQYAAAPEFATFAEAYLYAESRNAEPDPLDTFFVVYNKYDNWERKEKRMRNIFKPRKRGQSLVVFRTKWWQLLHWSINHVAPLLERTTSGVWVNIGCASLQLNIFAKKEEE